MKQLISYAQNFEDIMLWRALSSVETGCYVDIGAQSPLVDSISRVFYEHGWRGVHVDAMASFADQLRSDRPDEIVIQAAVSSNAGAVRFFGIAETGLSTTQEDIAQRHRDAGFVVHETIVPSITLDDVLSRVEGRVVHWLKIDVEGGEREVLTGWRSSSVRPWIVVIESTLPLTGDEVFDEWEHLVLDKGYEFAYFDGLNRYYVSVEQSQLGGAFSVPPNLFDNFALSTTSSTPFRREFSRKLDEMSTLLANGRELENALKSDLADTQARLVEQDNQLIQSRSAEERLLRQVDILFKNVALIQSELDSVSSKYREQAELAHRWWVTAEGMRSELSQIYASKSWRATGVFRAARRRFGPRRVAASVCRLLRSGILRVMLRLAAFPVVRRAAFVTLSVNPGFRRRLRQLLIRTANVNSAVGDVARGPASENVRHLPSPGELGLRASRVLRDIERAIEENRRGTREN